VGCGRQERRDLYRHERKQLPHQGRRRRDDVRRFSEQVSEDRLLEEKKRGQKSSPAGRPFIGRKGIGKLALLSCADTITVISKVSGGSWIGGVIDNSALDEAITEDLKPQQYPLGAWDARNFAKYTRGRAHRTIIHFDGLKRGIKGSFPLLAKIIALYFRFSLLDPNFEISLNGKKVTHKHLSELADKTEFLWKVGEHEDPFVRDLESAFSKNPDDHETKELEITGVRGFIASVEKPNDLKIFSTDERVGIDLFVNGRVRERDILKHIPTARIAESYMYGQVHSTTWTTARTGSPAAARASSLTTRSTRSSWKRSERKF
jgi:hypothetical protein